MRCGGTGSPGDCQCADCNPNHRDNFPQPESHPVSDEMVACVLGVSPQGEKPMPKTNVCPVCGREAQITCRCPRRDSQCASGHKWHTCTVHNIVVIGSSDHSTDTFTCTCPPPIPQNDDYEKAIRITREHEEGKDPHQNINEIDHETRRRLQAATDKYMWDTIKHLKGALSQAYQCGHRAGVNYMLQLTRRLDEHPETWDGPCECAACLSYGEEDGEC